MRIIRKIRKKRDIFSLILLIFIIFIFLFNVSHALADEPKFVQGTSVTTSTIDNDTETSILETDVSAVSTKFISKVSTKEGVTIIPPNGSKIVRVSDTSIDIQLADGNKTVNYSKTVDSISNISFSKSIDGLDDFNVKIKFADDKSRLTLTDTIVSYTIDWGNGDVTMAESSLPSSLVYTYKREGTYPITVKLIDSDSVTYTMKRNQSFKLTAAKFVQLWVGENKETVVVSSAGISGVALLGFALTETGKYKFLALLPLLIPMYMRVQKEDVLDQFVRGEIYGFIKANPGVHYNKIIRELDMKNGTLSYHLYMLEKTGMIKSRKEGLRYRAFYPTGMKFPEEERYRLTELQLDIIKIIKIHGGISQREIAEKLGEKHQTINYNVKVLKQAGLIGIRRQGRKTSCYLLKEPNNPDAEGT